MTPDKHANWSLWKENNKILYHACKYYDFNFNVTCILPYETSNPLPCADFMKFDAYSVSPIERQSKHTLTDYDWQSACGVGTVLGYNNLRALDFDNCVDFSIISKILNLLGLKENYPWVSISGSGKGFHIIFYCENHNFISYEVYGNNILALKPNLAHENFFSHVELRWTGHLVLPPSLHKSKLYYKFKGGEFPKTKPQWVSIDSIKKLLGVMFSRKSNDFSNFNSGYIDLDSDFTFSNTSEIFGAKAGEFKPGNPTAS